VSLSIECEHLSFAYDEGGHVLPAVVEVSLSVKPGASVALLGATGAGKSTLLQLVRGLLEPEMGLVRLDGVTRNTGVRSGSCSRCLRCSSLR
jgi:ABC-type bacteriocin/lantibiotic exporter with double-glycine peptidase domain